MGDSEQEYFVEGMHQALITELSRISALKVTSWTSTMRYRDTDKPLPQVARELNVDGVIEGSVLREGERLRITVQLIHGPTDRHLWAQTFDRELRGVLALQGELARAIASEIRITLTPAEEARLVNAPPVMQEAYDAYLKGLYHLTRQPPEVPKSLQYFRQSIDMDPTYAPAYVGLADSYNRFAIQGERPPREVYPLARAALVKAVELDDSFAEAHAVLGVVKFRFDWDWDGAERELRRALQLAPNSSRAHLAHGWYSKVMGRMDEMLDHLARSRDLDPLSLTANVALAEALYDNQRYDEAIALIHSVRELDPNSGRAYMFLGLLYAAKGMHGEAGSACQKALELAPEDHLVLSDCGQVYAQSGRHRDAVMAFEELTSLSARRHVDAYRVAALAAAIYTDPAESHRVLEWLARAYEERSANLCLLTVDPAFDGVRSDPRFQDLVRRMNFPG